MLKLNIQKTTIAYIKLNTTSPHGIHHLYRSRFVGLFVKSSQFYRGDEFHEIYVPYADICLCAHMLSKLVCGTLLLCGTLLVGWIWLLILQLGSIGPMKVLKWLLRLDVKNVRYWNLASGSWFNVCLESYIDMCSYYRWLNFVSFLFKNCLFFSDLVCRNKLVLNFLFILTCCMENRWCKITRSALLWWLLLVYQIMDGLRQLFQRLRVPPQSTSLKIRSSELVFWNQITGFLKFDLWYFRIRLQYCLVYAVCCVHFFLGIMFDLMKALLLEYINFHLADMDGDVAQLMVNVRRKSG